MLYITEVRVPKVKKGKLFVEQELPIEGALTPFLDLLSHEEHCKRALNQALQSNLNQVAKLNDVNCVSTEEETKINVSIVAMSPKKWKQFLRYY